MELNDKIIIYQTIDGQTSIEVKLEDETVWLSANQMATLFDRDEKTIRKHHYCPVKNGNWSLK